MHWLLTDKLIGTIGFVLVMVLLVVGPVSCAINENHEITERIKAACQGDLQESNRSAVCTLALTQTKF